MNTEVIIAIVAITLLYFTSRAAAMARNKNREVKADAMIKRGALLIDVRSKAEFDQGAYPGAINIPLKELNGRLAELGTDTTRPLLVYCASGLRSNQASAVLTKAGFTDLYNAGSINNLPLPPVR